MKEISETGYWNNETAHNHHVHCTQLSKWIINFLKDEKNVPLRDFGCGMGNYLKDLNDAGFKQIVGYEGDPPIKKVYPDIVKKDLTIPMALHPKGNVISLEVGEHIPAEFMNIYIDNICNACDNYLIVSWAIRNQIGFGHVNCLNNDEIIPEFTRRGFELLEKETKEVRNINLNEAPWFKNTLLVFKRVNEKGG